MTDHNAVFADEVLERQIVWLCIGGTPAQHKAIFRALTPEMFSCLDSRPVFEVAADLFLAGKPFGLPEISAKLKDQGKDLPLYFLDDSETSFADPAPLIARLAGLHAKRELAQRLDIAAQRLENEPALDVARSLVAGVLQTGAGKDEEPDAECLVASALTRYNSGERAGFSTGLDFLDTWTGGLVPGRLYVLGATKKTGKTRLAVAAMYGIAAQGGRCSMITLEMTPGEIVDLLNAKMCAINSGRLENRTLTDADKARLSDNATALKTVLDYLRLTAPACLTPDGLEAVIRFHVSLFKVKAIAIDFLTKIIVDTKFENAERGKICSRLSALARELNIAILLVVQLNKTAEQVESPHIGMIEGSGQIAQFADVIFILVNETRTRTDGPGNIAGEQTLKIHITQRQGACSNWLPIRARLQTLDFQSENL